MSAYRRTYLNQRLSGSFSGLSGFLKNRKILTGKREEAQKELQKIRAYSLHKDIKHKFKRRPILVNFINEIWSSDLKDIRSIAKYNNNNNFVLVVIDSLSKKAYTRMIKTKTPENVIRAFKSIFKEAGSKPVYLFTDRGTEFRSQQFMKFLHENGIHPYHVYSHIKAAFAERFIRTLFTKIQRYMTERNTHKFDDKLQEFTASYNNTFHRTIARTPNEVTKDNEYDVWKEIYKKYIVEKERPRQGPKFKVGDNVRISRAKLDFEKGNNVV